jgi:hypothetical protein
MEEAEAKQREKDMDYMLLYGIAKLFSMQSTRFIGEIKHQKEAYFFDQAVKYIDKYIQAVERNIKSPEAKHADDLLVDDMNNWIKDLKKHLLEV